jgi:hypothetical protein
MGVSVAQGGGEVLWGECLSDAGVLTVTLSKKAEAQPKQIKVQTGAKQPKQVEAGAGFEAGSAAQA